MKLTVMNKRVPVATLELDGLRVREVVATFNPEYAPPLVAFATNGARRGWQEWLCDRSESATRLDYAEVDGLAAKVTDNLGLNLSDQYWLRPEGSGLSWDDVNLFQHDLSRNNPDYSTNGNLPKSWIVNRDGERCLLKYGDFVAQNEEIASKLLDLLNLRHVPYTQMRYDGKPCSCCATFIDENTEYVPAHYIWNARKKSNNDSDYTHFLRCMDKCRIPHEPSELDNMLAFDSIIGNVDRHYGNFGFVRNVETLEYVGLAPIFDNEASLSERNWADCRPFAASFKEQLNLLKHITLDTLPLTVETVSGIVNESFKTYPYLFEVSVDRIVENVMLNITRLELAR